MVIAMNIGDGIKGFSHNHVHSDSPLQSLLFTYFVNCKHNKQVIFMPTSKPDAMPD